VATGSKYYMIRTQQQSTWELPQWRHSARTAELLVAIIGWPNHISPNMPQYIIEKLDMQGKAVYYVVAWLSLL